jgi:spectinomycin phosphotransferase
MLEKPDVPDEALEACLRDSFGVRTREIAFLPIGNDIDTAAYRVVADNGTPYFLKLRSWRRSGRFDAATVIVPRFLHDAGIAQVIAPVPTRDRELWALLDPFAVILFPFIAGRNGFAAPLTDAQWAELGGALRAMHTLTVPPVLRAQIPHETYDVHWRDRVKTLLAHAAVDTFTDPVAAQMAAFLCEKGDTIAHLLTRTETLATAIRARSPAHVLCHADIHAANVLIDAGGALYVVDWDTLIFAPKERDLMFIGGGIGGAWNSPEDEKRFYRGYGQTEIDSVALAYYRFERIIEDIAEYGERLMLTIDGGADREIGLSKFRTAFAPDNVVSIALRTDQI